MNKRNIVVYSISALMFVILSQAEFMNISSLNVGLLIALAALKLNAPIVSLMLILSGLLSFSFSDLIYNAVASAVVSAVWLIGKKYKPQNHIYVLSGIFAQIGLVIAAVIYNLNVVSVIVAIFLSLIFAYLCYTFGVPVIKNKLRYKLLDSELISGGIVLAALAYGLASIDLVFPFAPLLFAVVVLVGAKVMGSGGLCAGFCFALGFALKNGVDYVGAFALMSVVALVFIPAPRILSSLSLILSFVMYTFFFNIVPSNAVWWLASLLIGGVIYLALPMKKLEALKNFFAPDGRKALRGMVNHDRVAVGQKLEAVSGVFNEMSSIMDVEEGKISDNHLKELTSALVGNVCVLCPRYDVCSHSSVIGEVGGVMEAALESGRATVGELPELIKGNCVSIAALISASSDLANEYTERLKRLKNVNAAKKMVASQLKGMSDILAAMAKKESEPLRFDAEIEKKIAEELTYRTVVTSEVLVTGSTYPLTVMLTVLTDTVNKDTIKIVLKKLLGVPFCIDRTESGSLSGYTIVYASSKPQFDVVFSVCGCAKDKSGVSGDSHSFIKIDDHRFMMAICDGMGCGQRANDFSTSTISLIENFYRAGFSHSLVLSSVNDFLTLSSEEIYSAVDVAVVDLESGLCDIIKIGSPCSYVKTKDSVLRVEGSSLPIGVLEEMKPSIITYPLKGGETVVLTSDGAADSFGGDGIADVINNSTKMPEQLCKTVVDEALNITGKPCDDITVAAFHIFRAA